MTYKECFTCNQCKKENSKTWKILPVLFFLLISTGLWAQSFEKFETRMANAGTVEYQYLDKLVSGINPNIDLINGLRELDQSELPKVVITDVGSVPNLFEGNPDFDQIEMVKIMINSPSELQFSISSAQLMNFDKLSYVLIIFTFDICGNRSDACLDSFSRNMITGDVENFDVLYRISIPN